MNSSKEEHICYQGSFLFKGNLRVFSRLLFSQVLRIVFNKLKQTDLKIKISKCSFLKKEIHYLGHILLGKRI